MRMRVAGRLHSGVEGDACQDRPACGGGRAPASGRRRRRTTPSSSRRSACSYGRPARADSADARSARCRKPRSADRRRRRGSARGIPARTRRARSRQWTPTFSNTRPRIIAITPPPPGAPVWSVRCQGVRTKRPGRAVGQRRARRAGRFPAVEGGANVVAQLLEPGAGAVLAGGKRRRIGGGGCHRVDIRACTHKTCRRLRVEANIVSVQTSALIGPETVLAAGT